MKDTYRPLCEGRAVRNFSNKIVFAAHFGVALRVH